MTTIDSLLTRAAAIENMLKARGVACWALVPTMRNGAMFVPLMPLTLDLRAVAAQSRRIRRVLGARDVRVYREEGQVMVEVRW